MVAVEVKERSNINYEGLNKALYDPIVNRFYEKNKPITH